MATQILVAGITCISATPWHRPALPRWASRCPIELSRGSTQLVGKHAKTVGSLFWGRALCDRSGRDVSGKGSRISMSLGENSSQDASTSAELFQGMYGPWSVDSRDVREVVLYRAGLIISSATFIAAASTALLPDDNPVNSLLQSLYDPLYVVGVGGLGISLFLIHIYVTPIKRALQALWVVGLLGSLGIAANFASPGDQGMVRYVLEHPAAIWAVGPVFASLTGLIFKEGLCYGKVEAAALFFVIPSLLLGRLSGLMDEKVQLGLLAAWMALFALFASRKFTQPIKDDIGDKSVFMFNALPEDAKEALLLRLQEKQVLQTDKTS